MRFSAIIPAYNEAPRIKKVIEMVCESHFLDEIIVIDDGSTDGTKEIISHYSHSKLKKIFLSQNSGKMRAVIEGVLVAKGDYIVMIDSDLIGLTSKHIDRLISPINEGNIDTTLSLRMDSMKICRWFGSDFLSGDRVLPKSIFHDKEFFLKGSGYALEVKLNKKILQERYKIMNIDFYDVSAPTKRKKYGFFTGIKKDFLMAKEILEEVSIGEFIYQFFMFSRFSSRVFRDSQQKK